MPIPNDVLNVKRMLSERFLSEGAIQGVVGRVPTLSVMAATESAERNVHAVGIGSKVVEGKLTQEPCVRLYVVQKLAESLLPPNAVLPKEVDGIPTDVIESAPAFILPNGIDLLPQPSAAAVEPCTNTRRKRQRPVMAGISAAHFQVTAGTISCFCRSTKEDDDPERIFVLSNNHVFADVDRANVSDHLHQPGPVDGGTVTDRFALLHRWVPIQLGGQTPNKVDAAIGALLPEIDIDNRICTIGAVNGVGTAEETMVVSKHGRTTGYSEGFIFDLSVDALVGMDHSDPSIVARFVNQLRVNVKAPFPAFGLGGDSGSLVVNQSTREAIGLYNAGPPGGEYGLANRIEDVLTELEIELL
jgi:hypothetical protein